MKQLSGNLRLALILLASLLDRAGSAAEPSAAFSPDGRTLAVLDGKRTIRVWNVATGMERKKTTLALDPDELPARVSYTSAGDLVVLVRQRKEFKQGPGTATQETSSVCLWNLASGNRSPSIKIDSLGSVAVSPKGDLLANNGELWDVATGKTLRNVPLPYGIVYKIEFSPDGKILLYQICESLAQDYALLFLADTATGKELLQIGEIDRDKQRDGCFFFCYPKFSPDGNRVAFSQTELPALHLWDVAKGKALRRIPLKEYERVIGFSPDGRTLVSWHKHGGFVRLWEAATGKERHAYKVARGIEAVFLSPDGKTVALLKGKAVEFRALRE
jgi:WD40 repeat protein